MFRVWIAATSRWIENVPPTEALVYKEEGATVLRMDLPFTTPPNRPPGLRPVAAPAEKKKIGPLRSFADMVEVLKQHAAGVLSDVEAILALQCHPDQIEALLTANALPIKAFLKLDITDLEPDWDRINALAELKD